MESSFFDVAAALEDKTKPSLIIILFLTMVCFDSVIFIHENFQLLFCFLFDKLFIGDLLCGHSL